jgi:hypothetical protein
LISSSNDQRLAGTTQSADPTRKNEAKLEVIVARTLKPFLEVPLMPLKLLAFDTIADGKASLRFPASRPQATSPGVATLLVQPTGRPRAPFADTDGWRHGGINE